VCVDPQGRICVADGLNERIQIFLSNGTFVEEWYCPHPEAIGIDGEGCVYVTSNSSGMPRDWPGWSASSVTKFSPHGEELMRWELRNNNWQPDDDYYEYKGIAIAPNGHIYVGLSGLAPNLIQRWDADGNVLAQWAGAETPGQDLKVPKGLATDRFGNVLVANSHAHRVQKFTPDGEFLWQIGAESEDSFEFSNVTTVTVSDVGDLYVTDAGFNDLVFKFAPSGQ
jgi:sugar lactone lactonase YvrE